jgi:molybdate transport system substrate-binding protein
MRMTLQMTWIAALTLLASGSIASAAEIRLISVGGVKGALDPIIAEFNKATGHTVKYSVGSPLAVSQKLAGGEVFDVVVMSVPAIDDFDKIGGIRADTRVSVARGGIGLAVRPGVPVPNVSTPDAFRQALMAARSIGVGDPAMPNGSGVVIEKILAKSGMMDAIRDKIKIVGLDPGQDMIAKGDLEIGLMNSSEVRSFVTFAGEVPAPLQDYTNYEAVVTKGSAAVDAASGLVKMIASAPAAAHWKAARLEPSSGN